MIVVTIPRPIIACLLASLILTACSAIQATGSPLSPRTPSAPPAESTSAAACPLTEPEWVMPPEDAAVQNPPEFGYYYVNPDRSIWASAWWTGQEEIYLRASKEGIKVGWFRPAGATLEITGRLVDGPAPPLDAHIPCCYSTRFQSSGLYFPAEGCWQVSARAADSELTFFVRVEP